MTNPQDDPNRSPYTPAVHKDRPLSPGSIGGLDENTRQGLRAKLLESIMQVVVQALTGGFIPGIPAFTQLFDWAFDFLPDQIKQPLIDLVNILVTVLDSIPFIGPPLGNAVEDLAALIGLVNTNTNQANSNNNPAIASSDARIAALEAFAYGAGSGGFDDFNGSSLNTSKWGSFGGVSSLNVDDGHVTNSSIRRGNKFIESLAATKKYKCQSAVVDLGVGRSRMASAGNSSFTNYVAVDVDRSSSHAVDLILGNCTSPSSSAMTVRDTYSLAAGALKEADVVMLQVQEDTPVAGQNTITVYLTQASQTSPTLVCTWVDTANVLGTDGTNAHRNMALWTCIDANGSQPGCGWDVWSYADIP